MQWHAALQTGIKKISYPITLQMWCNAVILMDKIKNSLVNLLKYQRLKVSWVKDNSMKKRVEE